MYKIRPATPDDAPAINAIYNHYIAHSPATFDIEPWSLQRRHAWMDGLAASNGLYLLLVAEHQGQVVGFACNGQFKAKAAYDTSTETTIYLSAAGKYPGAGSQLYQALFDGLDRSRLHRAYAAITLPNAASLALHRKFGFECIGTMTQVGEKFGRFHDVSLYQKPL